jgi:hypothetical protein
MGIGIKRVVAVGRSVVVAEGFCTPMKLLSLSPGRLYVLSAVLQDPSLGRITRKRSVAGPSNVAHHGLKRHYPPEDGVLGAQFNVENGEVVDEGEVFASPHHHQVRSFL